MFEGGNLKLCGSGSQERPPSVAYERLCGFKAAAAAATTTTNNNTNNDNNDNDNYNE